MDVDHNGKLAYNEFISACLSKSASDSKNYLMFAFKYFDLNHDGKINRQELGIVLKAYKREYSENAQLIDKLL
jgi:Ca2+-binding EF-hand superfamily protein